MYCGIDSHLANEMCKCMQVTNACFDTAMNAVLEPTIVVGKEVDAARPDMPMDGFSLQGSTESSFPHWLSLSGVKSIH